MSFLLYLFILCVVFQVSYQLTLLIALLKHKDKQPAESNSTNGVSVVICVKNDAENLQKNLPFILNQEYPLFEVIVVDDGSDDNLDFLEDIKNSRLRILHISKEEKRGKGKKYPVQRGIGLAHHNSILFTDADCKPSSNHWIREMVNPINDTKKIVLGVSPYYTTKGFLNGVIHYETAQTALQYLGFALLDRAYMSVGRNVAYDTALIKTKEWTSKELSIASGDDDLSIQTLANKDNTTVCLSTHAYTFSIAPHNWTTWINQKLRHYESGSLYKFSDRIILGSYLISKLSLYIALLLLFTSYILTNYFISLMMPMLIYLFYVISITLINLILHQRFQLNSRWYLSVIHDWLYSFFTIILGTISQVKSSANWK